MRSSCARSFDLLLIGARFFRLLPPAYLEAQTPEQNRSVDRYGVNGEPQTLHLFVGLLEDIRKSRARQKANKDNYGKV